MPKTIKYNVFKTNWGYFGLAGTYDSIVRTYLPNRDFERIRSRILQDLPGSLGDRNLFKSVQAQIIAYFEGVDVDFDKSIPSSLKCLSQFAKSVLTACRDIRFGQTVSYSKLAKMAGHATKNRAVGRVMAQNPTPLIVPCHRIIYSNGKIGGFSARGASQLKARLLHHELQVLTAS